ncbi:hypothetical protein JMUB4039_0958 [Leptotrichia trevisanii]|uniref:hypothetical protein n=1 Tax=Leptotrichia trevisanii TaxID=109328 RepID=UPI00118AA6DE|nr:hypothetical protein [Leptotrichia trevisanii]BBM56980.1 hypothetical protein JMUB4039_0958 [Leptotrichia trevisanii]
MNKYILLMLLCLLTGCRNQGNDVVKAKRKLSDKVLKNSIRTIIMMSPEFSDDYMVGFMEDEKTLDILVIKGIEKIIKFVNTNTLVFL